jgi:CRISPR-associated protein Cmr1
LNKTLIHCKTTAPLFMAGAEPKSNPELRPAGIKGCMRFIWRAVHCAGDVDELRTKEGELFGNAYGGKATKQSDMRMRIEHRQLAIGKEDMLPHKNLGEYDGKRKDFKIPAIKSGFSFDVIVTSLKDTEAHVNYIRLFVVTSLLYGFGRRSRKGFGTVAITGIEGAGADINRSFNGLADNLNALSLFGARYTASGTKINCARVKTPTRYPFIESIQLAGTRKFSGTQEIIGQIGMAVHHHSGGFLGMAKPRFASSVLLSSIPYGENGYRCIVTQLHNTSRKTNRRKQDDFFIELDGRV